MTMPGMPVRTPNITLWVNGVRLPDGCLTAPDDSPVALTGLSVAWGRDSTIDQPSPATCTFDVLDIFGGERFVDVLTIGARLDVQATAQLYGPASIETIGTPLAYAVSNGTGTATARDIALIGTDHTRAVLTTIYPAPLSANPIAWDAIPRTVPGQRWQYTINPSTIGFAGWAAGAVTLEWLLLDSPSGRVVQAAPITAGTGTFVPEQGGWVALRARWYPVGPAWNQLDPPVAWDELDQRSWQRITEAALAGISVLAPPIGAVREAMVFSGRITDLEAAFDIGMGGTLVSVTAQDNTAELANRFVSSTPWPAESLITRWNRIITAANQSTASSVAASAQPAPITYRDVDNQPAAVMLAELAASVDGVLWSATHITTGPVLVLETLADRPPLMRLMLGEGGLVIIVPGSEFTTGRGVYLDACSVDLEPVRWSQDIADIATRVAVQWKDQTPDPTKPVDKTVTVTATELEAVIGVKRTQLSTQLSTSAAATTVANSMLARLSAGGWTVKGLQWDTGTDTELDSDRLATFMTMLDGTSRLGLPILLVNLPDWSPIPTDRAPLFLEGGRYHSDDGWWSLDLFVASARAVGKGVKWSELPIEWAWNEFDPDISWSDLNGVTV
jgi:hypothetical protein